MRKVAAFALIDFVLLVLFVLVFGLGLNTKTNFHSNLDFNCQAAGGFPVKIKRFMRLTAIFRLGTSVKGKFLIGFIPSFLFQHIDHFKIQNMHPKQLFFD